MIQTDATVCAKITLPISSENSVKMNMSEQPANTTSTVKHRVRAKEACEPCRKRKRKCDGHLPCAECVGYEYQCFFKPTPTNKRASYDPPPDDVSTLQSIYVTLNERQNSNGSTICTDLGHTKSSEVPQPTDAAEEGAGPRDPPPPSFLEPIRSRFVSADSALALPRSVGVELQAIDPPRLHSFAWNVNIRTERRMPTPSSIVRLVSVEDTHRFSSIYFEQIHPLYGFLDRRSFFLTCETLWSTSNPAKDFEAVFCGVIALGSFFSPSNPTPVESDLVEHARVILEATVSQPAEYISLYHVAAWILRAIYLRHTTRPHLSWMASCLAMNIAESIGIHQELASLRLVSVNGPRTLTDDELELRRRTFWVAWSINRLFSAEIGRSNIFLENSGCRLFSPRAGDYTTEVVELIRMLPSPAIDSATLIEREDIFEKLLKMPTHSPAIALMKADVCFCLYRRLRRSKVKLPMEHISNLLSIAQDGLIQALALGNQKRPWWNLISIPFYAICVFLAIDSRESLAMVNDAMDVLEQLTKIYGTQLGQEALKTARHLVRSSRQKKLSELGLLEKAAQETQGTFEMQSSSDIVILPHILEWPTEDLSGWAQFFT